MEKIAVTGHTGFIGRNLVLKLRKLGHEVILIDKNFTPTDCDRIYHLACPATTEQIVNNTIVVMDAILDLTRKAMKISKNALFINASSFGAADINETRQGAYNVSKRCMETYLLYSGINYVNYRIPSVYGEDASPDSFIKRCVLGTAYKPKNPSQIWPISHIDDVTDALINLSDIKIEYLTLGEIYEQFTTRKRTLERNA